MITEIEQQFFKVFGIEPKIYETNGRDIDDNGDICSWYIEEIYPEITDRVLLELICITINHYDYPKINNVKHLKSKTLSFLIKLKKENDYYGYKIQNKTLIKKIQSLFREGEE